MYTQDDTPQFVLVYFYTILVKITFKWFKLEE